MLLRRLVTLALCVASAAPPSLAASASARTTPQTPQTQSSDARQRLELPASGDVRVENYRGGVELSVWGEDYVAVASTGGESAPAPVRTKGRRRGARRAAARPK